MNKLIKPLVESKNEIDKVIFPNKLEIKTAFFNVVFMVSFISLFLLLLDTSITSLIAKFL